MPGFKPDSDITWGWFDRCCIAIPLLQLDKGLIKNIIPAPIKRDDRDEYAGRHLTGKFGRRLRAESRQPRRKPPASGKLNVRARISPVSGTIDLVTGPRDALPYFKKGQTGWNREVYSLSPRMGAGVFIFMEAAMTEDLTCTAWRPGA